MPVPLPFSPSWFFLYSQLLSIFENSPQRYAFLSKYPTKSPKFFKNHQNFENFCRKIWRLSFFSISLHPLNHQTRRFCTIRYNPVSSDWRDGWVAETTGLLNRRTWLGFHEFESRSLRLKKSFVICWCSMIYERFFILNSFMCAPINVPFTWYFYLIFVNFFAL